MGDNQTILLIAYISGLLGAILIWVYGIPRTDVTQDGAETLLASPSEKNTRENMRKWARHDRASHLGIALIGLSFILQITSLWIE